MLAVPRAKQSSRPGPQLTQLGCSRTGPPRSSQPSKLPAGVGAARAVDRDRMSAKARRSPALQAAERKARRRRLDMLDLPWRRQAAMGEEEGLYRHAPAAAGAAHATCPDDPMAGGRHGPPAGPQKP